MPIYSFFILATVGIQNGQAEPKPPEVVVSLHNQVRKDFSAFDDVYPELSRGKVMALPKRKGAVIGHMVVNLGNVNITSGKIAAFDAITGHGGAFAKEVANGEYPVLLAIEQRRGAEVDAKNERPPWLFVIFARIEIADRPAVRWELASFADEKLNEKADSARLTGFGVDTGTAAFADAASWEILKKAPEKLHDEVDKKLAVIHGQLETAPTWARVEFGKATMFRFGSFGGDGRYPSYWGYDKDGKLVALMTDFGIREWVGKPAERK